MLPLVPKGDGTQGMRAATASEWLSDGKRSMSSYTDKDSKFSSISALPLSSMDKGQDLTVQHQAGPEEDVKHGVSYVETGPRPEDPETFEDSTPHNIILSPGMSHRQYIYIYI